MSKVNRFRRRSVVVSAIIISMSLSFVAGRTLNSESGPLSRNCFLNQVKANPKDPHSFYWCLTDGPVLMKCIKNLVFNSILNKCVSEEILEQEPEWNDIILQEERSQKLSIRSTTSKNVSSYSPPSVKCPLENYNIISTTSIYLPNPLSCSSFYQCSHGKPYLIKCPEGLSFNPLLKVCDYSIYVPDCPPEKQQSTQKKPSIIASKNSSALSSTLSSKAMKTTNPSPSSSSSSSLHPFNKC